jgi:hypothetical protein
VFQAVVLADVGCVQLDRTVALSAVAKAAPAGNSAARVTTRTMRMRRVMRAVSAADGVRMKVCRWALPPRARSYRRVFLNDG